MGRSFSSSSAAATPIRAPAARPAASAGLDPGVHRRHVRDLRRGRQLLRDGRRQRNHAHECGHRHLPARDLYFRRRQRHRLPPQHHEPDGEHGRHLRSRRRQPDCRFTGRRRRRRRHHHQQRRHVLPHRPKLASIADPQPHRRQLHLQRHDPERLGRPQPVQNRHWHGNAERRRSYTGSTAISGGKLSIAAAGSISSTSGVTIGAAEFNDNSSTPLSTGPVSFTSTGGILSGSNAEGSWPSRSPRAIRWPREARSEPTRSAPA